jgi:hypothetical protein
MKVTIDSEVLIQTRIKAILAHDDADQAVT